MLCFSIIHFLEVWLSDDSGVTSAVQRVMLYFGIINFLQLYLSYDLGMRLAVLQGRDVHANLCPHAK